MSKQKWYQYPTRVILEVNLNLSQGMSLAKAVQKVELEDEEFRVERALLVRAVERRKGATPVRSIPLSDRVRMHRQFSEGSGY